jgi:hypothetical protein
VADQRDRQVYGEEIESAKTRRRPGAVLIISVLVSAKPTFAMPMGEAHAWIVGPSPDQHRPAQQEWREQAARAQSGELLVQVAAPAWREHVARVFEQQFGPAAVGAALQLAVDLHQELGSAWRRGLVLREHRVPGHSLSHRDFVPQDVPVPNYFVVLESEDVHRHQRLAVAAGVASVHDNEVPIYKHPAVFIPTVSGQRLNKAAQPGALGRDKRIVLDVLR